MAKKRKQLGSTSQDHVSQAQQSYHSAAQHADHAMKLINESRCKPAFRQVLFSAEMLADGHAHHSAAGAGTRISSGGASEKLEAAEQAMRIHCIVRK